MSETVKQLLDAPYTELEHLTQKASTEVLKETYEAMVDMKFARSKIDIVRRAIHARTPMKEIMVEMRRQDVRSKFESEWTSMQKMFEGLKKKKQERLAANE